MARVVYEFSEPLDARGYPWDLHWSPRLKDIDSGYPRNEIWDDQNEAFSKGGLGLDEYSLRSVTVVYEILSEDAVGHCSCLFDALMRPLAPDLDKIRNSDEWVKPHRDVCAHSSVFLVLLSDLFAADHDSVELEAPPKSVRCPMFVETQLFQATKGYVGAWRGAVRDISIGLDLPNVLSLSPSKEPIESRS